MASLFEHPAMASPLAMLNTTIELPVMQTWYEEGILSARSLVAVLVLWATYCFCGAVYRCKEKLWHETGNSFLIAINSVP